MTPTILIAKKESGELLGSGRGLGWMLALSVILSVLAPLEISLAPAAQNPAQPEMGNWLKFHSEIKNTGSQALSGLVVWISLVGQGAAGGPGRLERAQGRRTLRA